MPRRSLNKNTWHDIKISSYFNLWKLDCFSDIAFLNNIFDTRKILDYKPCMLIFINPAKHIEFLPVILKSDMDPECILLNINTIPIDKAFPVWVLYITEKVCILKSW